MGVPKRGERCQSLRYKLILTCIRYLDKESYRHEIKCILFVKIAETLHNHKQIILLSQLLVVLHVIYHLEANSLLYHIDALIHCFYANSTLFTLDGLYVTQTRKFYTVTHGIPFEIEH